MANKYLTREDAPVPPETWEKLDSIVVEAAKSVLTGRRLLSIEGPYGLGLKSVPLDDTEDKSGLITSGVLPLSFIHRSFSLSKRDLAAYERDKLYLNAAEVARVAIECASLEDNLIFKGTSEVPGLTAAKGVSKSAITEWREVGVAADEIISAVTTLDSAGFHGPYALALAPRRYNMLLRRYPTGTVSEIEHIKTIVTEGVFKAPVLESGGVLIATGKQFASIILGQDMSLGFIGPAAESLEFAISESLVLLIREPRAICALKE